MRCSHLTGVLPGRSNWVLRKSNRPSQKDIRALRRAQAIKLLGGFGLIYADFLTGSYRRETKTKPLRDVDIIVVRRTEVLGGLINEYRRAAYIRLRGSVVVIKPHRLVG